jgi:hypothetical protein
VITGADSCEAALPISRVLIGHQAIIKVGFGTTKPISFAEVPLDATLEREIQKRGNDRDDCAREKQNKHCNNFRSKSPAANRIRSIYCALEQRNCCTKVQDRRDGLQGPESQSQTDAGFDLRSTAMEPAKPRK